MKVVQPLWGAKVKWFSMNWAFRLPFRGKLIPMISHPGCLAIDYWRGIVACNLGSHQTSKIKELWIEQMRRSRVH